MATKPELLDQDTTVDDNDLIMKTDSLNVTKTIKGGNLFTWIWNKIKAKILSNEITLHAVDEAKPYYPVDSTAVIHSAISTMDVTNPAPINSAALNGALYNCQKSFNYYVPHGQQVIHPAVNTGNSDKPKYFLLELSTHSSYGESTHVSLYIVRLNYTPFNNVNYYGCTPIFIGGNLDILTNFGDSVFWADNRGIVLSVDNPTYPLFATVISPFSI